MNLERKQAQNLMATFHVPRPCIHAEKRDKGEHRGNVQESQIDQTQFIIINMANLVGARGVGGELPVRKERKEEGADKQKVGVERAKDLWRGSRVSTV